MIGVILGLFIIGGIAAFLIRVRNSLVVLRNRVKDQKAQIDVCLKQRYDTLPNLFETTKAYGEYEKTTLETIVNERRKLGQTANTQEALTVNSELTKQLGYFFAVSEQYPELKTSQHFQTLQKELKSLENKLSKARQFYNDTVLLYNNQVMQFPNNLVAVLFGFQVEEFLKTASEEQKVLSIQAKQFQNSNNHK
ncbi:LemA family protein [Enterococcus sp. AZ072]|uniref:LemA family protein n=1 Tax=unclassified Enterococcus TaxID=2608891 RepID=UPI003D2D0C45